MDMDAWAYVPTGHELSTRHESRGDVVISAEPTLTIKFTPSQEQTL